MTPQSVQDLSAALEEVIAETERMQESLKMSARILRAVKLKLLETEHARITAEAASKSAQEFWQCQNCKRGIPMHESKCLWCGAAR